MFGDYNIDMVFGVIENFSQNLRKGDFIMQKKNENKKNKKVVVVAAMALLLALVGISGGETYAKYVSSQKDTATATVAKWGYTITANADDLFGESYSGPDANKLCAPLADDTGVNVNAASNGANVVAPGTKGSAIFTVGGDAEVLSSISFNLDVRDICLKTNEAEIYYPIKWTLTVKKDGNPVYEGTSDADTTTSEIESLCTSAEAKVTDEFTDIEPNTPVDLSISLTWSWAFEGQNDDLDTVFGGLISKASTLIADDGTANWGVADKTYNHLTNVGDQSYTTYTDNGSVFTTNVAGTISVSQVQK